MVSLFLIILLEVEVEDLGNRKLSLINCFTKLLVLLLKKKLNAGFKKELVKDPIIQVFDDQIQSK